MIKTSFLRFFLRKMHQNFANFERTVIATIGEFFDSLFESIDYKHFFEKMKKQREEKIFKKNSKKINKITKNRSPGGGSVFDFSHTKKGFLAETSKYAANFKF